MDAYEKLQKQAKESLRDRRRGVRLPDDERIEILRLVSEGVVYREVADQFNVSIATVSRIVNEERKGRE